jgi:hypothetical protein
MELNEKSSSKSQQRLMGMVYAYKAGKLKLDSLNKSLADKIKSIADGHKNKNGKKYKGISLEDAEDFARTKHKGLPETVQENIISFSDFTNESVKKEKNIGQQDPALWHQIQVAKKTLQYSDTGAIIMGGMTKDEARALLTKHNIRFKEEQEPKKKEDENKNETVLTFEKFNKQNDSESIEKLN